MSGTAAKNAIIVEKLREIRAVLESEGVRHLTLFGSQARGDARPDSDVDIAIEVAPGSGFSILNLVGVEQIVSDATGKPANAFMRRSLDKGFQEELESAGVPVF